MNVPVARSVFIISDLHLGGIYAAPGGRGFRLNTHVPDLTDFVTDLARRPADPRIELVINGDMVDFLAEERSDPFIADPDAACTALQAITDRDRPFFDALKSFLDAGHRLTILTGNHDIELALPAVRRKLRDVIGVRKEHDYEFIFNGEAYVVGDALIEHGNRYALARDRTYPRHGQFPRAQFSHLRSRERPRRRVFRVAQDVEAVNRAGNSLIATLRSSF